MLRKLKNLFRDEKGQDMIEYALLSSLVAIVVIAVLVLVGQAIVAVFQTIIDVL